MDLIVYHQRMKLYSLFIRTVSNYLPSTCFQSTNSVTQFNRRLQSGPFREYSTNFEKSICQRILPTYICTNRKFVDNEYHKFQSRVCKYTTDSSRKENDSCQVEQTRFQKMKQMAKDYWYILIPVHVATSIIWFSVFYIAAKNGVNVEEVLRYLHLSETYLEKIRNSSAGHLAVAYALYKVCTPFRYTVTLGGTTMTIRYLNKWGIMKFKTPEKMKDMLSSKTVVQTKVELGKIKEKTKTVTGSSKT
ncbi:uncharacterized protein C18orf19 homolog A [Leptopilina heterotoma]|uniref:uncharacterized protein C18orf19 homolog A n=1 Tax=Leptopilina heterotoma TaxID=63436 RepID=UPI001CA7F458|nr:uncharacterized protein C18orf19 homolog A [Leptopilina heterotoma]